MYKYQTAAVYYPGPRAVTRTKHRRKIILRKRAVRRVKLLAAALVNLLFHFAVTCAVVFVFMAMFCFLA